MEYVVCAWAVDTRARVRAEVRARPRKPSARISLKFPQFVRRPARLGLIAAALALAAGSQRSSRSPFEIPEIWPGTGSSELADRRLIAQDARRFEVKMQDLVRAWNSFATEYVDRGTFNIKKAREVGKAWRSLESESPWPKK